MKQALCVCWLRWGELGLYTEAVRGVIKNWTNSRTLLAPTECQTVRQVCLALNKDVHGVCVCVHARVCAYVSMCSCMCRWVCASVCVQATSVCVCAYMGVCMCVCAHVCVCALCVPHCLLYKSSKILVIWPNPDNTNFGESLSCVDTFMVRSTWPGLVFW